MTRKGSRTRWQEYRTSPFNLSIYSQRILADTQFRSPLTQQSTHAQVFRMEQRLRSHDLLSES